MILPDGTRRPVRLTHESAEMAGVVAETQQAGDYTLEVTAMQGPTELGRAKARFLVYEQDLELDNAAADPTLLASLAKMSEAAGGRLLAPEELPALLDELAQRPVEANGRARSEGNALGHLALFLAVHRRAVGRLVFAQKMGPGLNAAPRHGLTPSHRVAACGLPPHDGCWPTGPAAIE